MIKYSISFGRLGDSDMVLWAGLEKSILVRCREEGVCYIVEGFVSRCSRESVLDLESAGNVLICSRLPNTLK